MNHRLEQYYCGDAAWSAFVETFSSHWAVCQFKEELVNTLHGHLDVAKVVYGIMGDTSLSWVVTEVPALDGLLPVDCANSADRLQRLKSMLMRIPL